MTFCLKPLHPRCPALAGIKAAVCELPYGKVASDSVGGAGGTCVLRGCVPKKLMVFGGEFSEAFRDSVAFGCDACCSTLECALKGQGSCCRCSFAIYAPKNLMFSPNQDLRS